MDRKALSPATVEVLRNLLLEKRKALVGDLEGLESEACKTGGAAAPEGSTVPLHLGDIGSDAFEQDLSLDLAGTRADEIRQVDHALERMQKNCYGLCQACGKAIAFDRLMAIPYAELCLLCKSEAELT
jgi:RNA polymerase-binding transcription factor DksA